MNEIRLIRNSDGVVVASARKTARGDWKVLGAVMVFLSALGQVYAKGLRGMRWEVPHGMREDLLKSANAGSDGKTYMGIEVRYISEC